MCAMQVNSTVLQIAHHVESVAACDWVVVLDGGRVAEQGQPRELLAQPRSAFAALVRAAQGGTL